MATSKGNHQRACSTSSKSQAAPVPPPHSPPKYSSPAKAPPADGRAALQTCLATFLAGPQDSGLGRRPCPRMRCTACDFEVARLPGRRWGGGLEYLHLRQHMPFVERPELLEHLEADPRAAAYACQCSWRTVTAPERISFLESKAHCGKPLRWCCAGHGL